LIDREKKKNIKCSNKSPKKFHTESEANGDVIGDEGAGVLYFLQHTSSGLHVKQYESAHAEGMFS